MEPSPCTTRDHEAWLVAAARTYRRAFLSRVTGTGRVRTEFACRAWLFALVQTSPARDHPLVVAGEALQRATAALIAHCACHPGGELAHAEASVRARRAELRRAADAARMKLFDACARAEHLLPALAPMVASAAPATEAADPRDWKDKDYMLGLLN